MEMKLVYRVEENEREMIMDQITHGFTHGGFFHADDVFSTALLTMLFPGFTYERGFVVPDNFEGIVYDIGFGEFDHHQADKQIRKNGVPYASFGLLWKKYGEMLMSSEDAKKFDEEFVQPIDEVDNNGGYNGVSHIIKMFNPNWNDEKSSDQAFSDAVSFACEILEKYVAHYTSVSKAGEEIEKCMMKCDGKVLYLDRWMPWIKQVAESSYLYVVFPSVRGGYTVQLVPKNANDRATKITFPKKWYGLHDEELERISGIEGLSFCHGSGFMCCIRDIDVMEKVMEKC